MGSGSASKPDEIGDSNRHDFRLTFGMIILNAHDADRYIFVVPCFFPSAVFISLAAGRIWWIRRDVVSALEPCITRVYGTVIAMMYDEASYLCMTN
jgi:hypothetical protein